MRSNSLVACMGDSVYTFLFEHLEARENFGDINAYERITMEVFVWGSTSGPRGSEQETLPSS